MVCTSAQNVTPGYPHNHCHYIYWTPEMYVSISICKCTGDWVTMVWNAPHWTLIIYIISFSSLQICSLNRPCSVFPTYVLSSTCIYIKHTHTHTHKEGGVLSSKCIPVAMLCSSWRVTRTLLKSLLSSVRSSGLKIYNNKVWTYVAMEVDNKLYMTTNNNGMPTECGASPTTDGFWLRLTILHSPVRVYDNRCKHIHCIEDYYSLQQQKVKSVSLLQRLSRVFVLPVHVQ